jgi:hydrogenase expression/formation protein HypC
MCLGIPGRITAITDAASKLAMVDVLGVQREINIACVLGPNQAPETCLDAWVLVHVGFAMSRIDEREAALTLELLHALGEAQAEAQAMRASAVA